jgi:hypothetical protein
LAEASIRRREIVKTSADKTQVRAGNSKRRAARVRPVLTLLHRIITFADKDQFVDPVAYVAKIVLAAGFKLGGYAAAVADSCERLTYGSSIHIPFA